MVLLTRLAKQVYRRSSEELLGMHLRLLMALSYVRDHDGAPQQELAEALCMDANNVVLLLNELEDLRLRRAPARPRRPPPPPRRADAAGRARAERAERAQEAIEDEVLQALDARGTRDAVAAADARALREPSPRSSRALSAARLSDAQPSATIASISTCAPRGSAATPTVTRAGGVLLRRTTP